MIFDIKLGSNLRRNDRLVERGHKTNSSSSITYSSLVLRDSVGICLLITELIDLDIQSEDIEDAYSTAPCREKIWTRASPKFEQDEGKVFINVMELYDLKSSREAFKEFLADKLDEM